MKIKVPLCRHLKTNGTQCKSPALEFSQYCYFHDRLHERHKYFRHTKATKEYLLPGQDIQLHALEDAESIQLAISLVINALAVGSLKTERATALLYGLQLASLNVRRLAPKPDPSEVVREIATTPDGLDCASKSEFLSLTPDQETGERLERELAFIKAHNLQSELKALPIDTASLIKQAE